LRSDARDGDYAGAMATALPDQSHRWRCGGCGNLTRFDVTRTRRTTEYWHFDLAGEPAIEESTLRHESVESVSCRWCGRADAIETVTRAEAAADMSSGAAEAGSDPDGGG
jgi:hypothetical protein